MRIAVIPVAGLCWLALAAVSGAGAADTSTTATAASCQSAGWDMSRELKAFLRPPLSVVAGNSAASAPLFRSDILYALRLRAQTDVVFVQPQTRPGKAATPMAGMTRFSVPTKGLYRITVDSPLWIDVVTAGDVLAPTGYTGWHDCSVFRKSVDYTLEADQAVILQFSDAATDLVKVTIEPPSAP